jgi:hypothetical protein
MYIIYSDSKLDRKMAAQPKQETRFDLPGFTLPLNWKPVSGLDSTSSGKRIAILTV